MVTNSILLVINKVCGYLDNIRYVDIISVADIYLSVLEEHFSPPLVFAWAIVLSLE